MTATKTKKYCVYAGTLVSATRTTFAPGDGITRSSRRIYAICETEREALATLATLNRSRVMMKARIPGDATLWPELEVDEFNPLDFVGSQSRRQGDWDGKRRPLLVASLYEQAKANAASLA